jgi:hypothetical protein
MAGNYPDGFTQGQHDRIFGRAATDRNEGRRELCAICRRELEWDTHNGKVYYSESLLRGADPRELAGGACVCSQKCLSQYVYDNATVEDQQALRELARACYDWREYTAPNFDRWCLEHSALHTLIDPLNLRLLNTAMDRLHQSLGGDDEEPRWFLEAVGEVDYTESRPPTRAPFDFGSAMRDAMSAGLGLVPRKEPA